MKYNEGDYIHLDWYYESPDFYAVMGWIPESHAIQAVLAHYPNRNCKNCESYRKIIGANYCCAKPTIRELDRIKHECLNFEPWMLRQTKLVHCYAFWAVGDDENGPRQKIFTDRALPGAGRFKVTLLITGEYEIPNK